MTVMYQITEGCPADFTDVESLVARTIREPFDRPDLTPEQRAEFLSQSFRANLVRGS